MRYNISFIEKGGVAFKPIYGRTFETGEGGITGTEKKGLELTR